MIHAAPPPAYAAKQPAGPLRHGDVVEFLPGSPYYGLIGWVCWYDYAAPVLSYWVQVAPTDRIDAVPAAEMVDVTNFAGANPPLPVHGLCTTP